jgi:AraC-like DNA-binding protein
MKEKIPTVEYADLRWLCAITFMIFAILSLYIIDFLIDNTAFECFYMFSSLVIWIFICYFLYRHESIINEIDSTEPSEEEPIVIEANDELTRRIEQLFAVEKIYLNPGLKLSDVASMAATNRTYISHFFNRGKNGSFYTYVNRYRVDHACRLLKESNDTIEYIAEQSGFKSKATFYRVFTDIKGCSPSKYRQVLSS